jgi:hypothetical protein
MPALKKMDYAAGGNKEADGYVAQKMREELSLADAQMKALPPKETNSCLTCSVE